MDLAIAPLSPWKRQATDLQASYRQALGNRKYDHFTDTDLVPLNKKLGFAMFGAPAREPTQRDCGYNREQTSRIDEVFRFIRDANKGAHNYYVSFVFVVCHTEAEQYVVPVFRINCCGENSCGKVHGFVDDTPRFYDSWEHYLDTNLLPKCGMGYPSEGSYWIPSSDNRDFQVKFQNSPAHSTANMIRSHLNGARVGVGLVSAASTIAAPVAAPIVQGVASIACNAIDVYLNVYTLVDRSDHRQSISLADPTARACYLNIAAGVMGAVSTLGLLRLNTMAMSGERMSVGVRIAVDGLTYVTVVVNGARVANHFANIIQKRRNGESVTGEVAALAASAFFFYNTILTAERVRQLADDMCVDDLNGTSGAVENYSLINMAPLNFILGSSGTRGRLRQVNDFVWDELSAHSAEPIRLLWNSFVKATENYARLWLDVLGQPRRTVSLESLELGDVMQVRTAMARVKRWIDGNLPDEDEQSGNEASQSFMRGFLQVCGNVERRLNVRRGVRESISRLFFIQQHARQRCDDKVASYERDFELLREDAPGMLRERFDRRRGIVGDYKQHFMATVIREMKDGGGFELLCNAIEIMRAENICIDEFEMEADGIVIPFEGIGLEEQGLRDEGGGGRPSGIDPDNVQFVVNANQEEATIVFTDPSIGIRKITIDGSMHDGRVSGSVRVQC